VLLHATYIPPRDLPQLQNSTASQKRHSLQIFADGAGPSGRFAMAGGLVVLTALMGVGIFGVAAFMWRPLLEAMK